MALGDSYATLTEIKTRLDIADTTDDDRLTASLASASREIEAWCGRQFNDAGTASARKYRPTGCHLVTVDDFHTTAGLVVETDTDDDGTFDTTWTSGDYELEPFNGVVSGMSGWPYNQVRAVESLTFPTGRRRATVQVTAQWGWAAVPAPVKEACLMIASETFKAGDAPFGVAGFGEFGPVRIRMNTQAQTLLAPYRLHPVLVA